MSKPVAKTTLKSKPKAKATISVSKSKGISMKGSKTSPATRHAVKNFYILTDVARPRSGPRLYAHTAAAFHVLGMFQESRPQVMRSAVQTLIGQRALRYHKDDVKTLEASGDLIRLTVKGVAFFHDRLKAGRVKKADVDRFATLFKSGTIAPELKVKQSQVVLAPVTV